MKKRFKLTDVSIATKCPLTKPGEPAQRIYWDSKLRGFGILCGRNVRAFIVRRDVAGRRHVQVTIGRFGHAGDSLTADVARAKAHGALAEMAAGIDPNRRTGREKASPRGKGADTLTLQDALDLHSRVLRQARKSARTIEDLHKPLHWYMSDWLPLPLGTITRCMCFDRHCAISERAVDIRTKDGTVRKGGGPIVANRAMQALRAAWNATRRLHPDVPEHPVYVTWNEEARAEDLLRVSLDDLATWWREIDAQLTGARKDWVLTMLYTGLRESDCASIRWDDIDFTARTLTRPEPKGGRKRAFTVPIADQVLAIFKRRRRENRFEVEHDHGYVFPTYRRRPGEACGVCAGPCRITFVQSAKMRQHTFTVAWTPHALRRTFAMAGAESEVPEEVRDTLLNHAADKRDMTRRYPGRPSDERLRRATQQIADFLNEHMQPAVGAKVVEMARGRH